MLIIFLFSQKYEETYPCSAFLTDFKTFSRGRRYELKKRDYLQILLAPLILDVISVPDEESKNFFWKLLFLPVSPAQNSYLGSRWLKIGCQNQEGSLFSIYETIECLKHKVNVMLYCKQCQRTSNALALLTCCFVVKPKP